MTPRGAVTAADAALTTAKAGLIQGLRYNVKGLIAHDASLRRL